MQGLPIEPCLWHGDGGINRFGCEIPSIFPIRRQLGLPQGCIGKDLVGSATA